MPENPYPPRSGVGLSNLKERVQLAYGTAGSFTLQTQEPSGMLATLAPATRTYPPRTLTTTSNTTMRTTVLLAEDEPLMRERLEGLLQSCWPDADVVAVAENGNDAWDSFLEHTPQVVFLDIRMPGMTGLEVAQRIGNRAHVVFVTAYDQYAVHAFEAGAVDYLLKPLEQSRLELTIERLRQKLSAPPAALDAILKSLQAALPTPPREKLQLAQSHGGQADQAD